MGVARWSWRRDPVELRPIDLPTALLVAVAALCCSVVLGCAFVLLAGVRAAELSAGQRPGARCLTS